VDHTVIYIVRAQLRTLARRFAAPAEDIGAGALLRSDVMTPPHDVRQQVRLILAQTDVKHMYRTSATPWLPVDPLQLFTTGFHDSPLFDLANEQVDLLKRLYVSLPSDAQKLVVNAIVTELNAKNGRIVAHAVVELRDVAALRYWERVDDAAAELWDGIVEKLKIEHGKFAFPPPRLKGLNADAEPKCRFALR